MVQRDVAPSGAGTKRKGHPWFPFLFELLPFLQRAWLQMVDCVSVEKESGRGFFLPRGILTFAFQIITATHTGYSTQGAAQGELPEGQERVLWSMTVPRKPFSGANWLQPQDLDNLHR